MKQKIVFQVQMKDAKTRSNAIKLAAGFPGVVSASLEGEDKSQIVVTGEEVDSVSLKKLLQKRIGNTDFVSVGHWATAKKDAPSGEVALSNHMFQYEIPNLQPAGWKSCVIM